MLPYCWMAAWGVAPERVRFRELAADVLLDYDTNQRRTTGDVQRRLELHILPALGDVRAAEFTTTLLKRYIANRKQAGARNSTINRELAIVKRAFRLAAANDPPLVARVPHVPMLREDNVRRGFIEHDTYIKLRNALPLHLQAIFVVGYHLGARIGELRSLGWDQIDFAASRIALLAGATKNGEPRTMPIYGEMRSWLAMQKEARDLQFPGRPWVFHRGGQRLTSIRAAWEKACKTAGVPGLLFHDLRRTAVRNMVRAGIPERVAMQISGHKTRSVFERYNIVSDRDLSDAAAKMERHLGTMSTVSSTIEQLPKDLQTGSPS